MNVVLNPEVLFIDDEEWGREETRDNYLNKILDLLDYIDDYPRMFIYWNDDFELLLWDAPIRHPWYVDRDFRIPLVQTLRNKLNKNKIEIEDSILYDPCTSNSQENLRTEVLQMMHYCLDEQDRVYFVTKEKQKAELVFRCEHSNEMVPHTVINYGDFLQKDQIIEDMWPKSALDSNSFDKLVRLFISGEERPVLYEYEFTDLFIKSILDYKNMGHAIVNQVAKRLTLQLKEAQNDPSLHDELVEQTKERRMRVTGRPSSTRIHYIFLEKGKIQFKRFYGPGEHDKGL